MNRKLIVLLIFLIVILLALLGITLNISKNKMEETVDFDDTEHSEEYYEIMNLDLVNEYPEEYLDVIDVNSKIVSYEYSDEIQKSEIDDILSKQRQLFSTNLLELNTLESQKESYLEEIDGFREWGRYITDRKILTSKMVAYDGSVAEVLVDESYNDGLVLQYTYYLIFEDGKWKILSWDRDIKENSINEITKDEE